MKILVLGGTIFLGKHFVLAALAAGHELTLFNRGKSNPDLFAELEQIHGDRDGGLSALQNRHFDAVFDPSGYIPRVVGDSARFFADRCEHYTFVSSISVYGEFGSDGPTENSPVATLDDPACEELTGETYGALKALCEQAAEQAIPGRVLNVRPGLIVGPDDPSDRFTFWPVRALQAGDLLAPGYPESPVQVIDVRDLAAWLLRMIESGQTGVFNATGPEHPLTMAGLIETCFQVTDVDHRPIWVSEEFLIAREVTPFGDIPCWIPRKEEGMERADISQALAKGLKMRDLVATVQDMLAWRQKTLADSPLRAGYSLSRERELLDLWLVDHS
jgi:2'-hydroxyisoflavone reductase